MQELLAPILLSAMEGEALRSAAAGPTTSPDPSQPQLLDYQAASDQASAVMEVADLVRRAVYERVRHVLCAKRTRHQTYSFISGVDGRGLQTAL